MGFSLSMLLNLDATITVGVVLYVLASTLTNMATYLYDYMGGVGRAVLVALTYGLPQFTLFDLSEKTVHAESWPPLSWATLGALSVYGAGFAALYFLVAALIFRRRAL
jgi:hypothetical protein